MKTKAISSLLGSVLLLLMFNESTFAAPKDPCTKPNPPAECGEPPAPPTPAAAVVNSATVDWFNQKIIVRGENLDPAAPDPALEFSLGGSLPLATSNVTPSSLDIPFDSDLANAVMESGNYQLNVDGTDVLSLFVKSQIIDPAAAGCPCQTEWETALALLGSPEAPECLEINGSDVTNDNDIADIAGTLLSGGDDTVYPQYPIGAAFYPGDPDRSVCRLVQVNSETPTVGVDLVNFRINEQQQAECATILRENNGYNYCAITTPLP